MTVVNIVAIFVVNICRYINDGQYLFMSAEMSDLVKIRFFYGPGRVQMCDTGADLSEFQYIDVDLQVRKHGL